MQEPGYKLVQLANGTCSVHSLAHAETFHPVIGPAAEAETLYVRQLKLRERLARQPGEFVIWDIGLGSAGNVLTALRATRDLACTLRVVSFDHTIEPLRFALQHSSSLKFLAGYEGVAARLISGEHRVTFQHERQQVRWELRLGDFPSLMQRAVCQAADTLPKPHAIFFDAFSPAKNPAMWTAPLLLDLFRLLDPQRACSLATYSRSTMCRVALLLAGFFVGAGHGIGEKEETTIAANTLDLIEEPLGSAWLDRARKSTSAEPLWNAVYRQAPISEETWERLKRHPQFGGSW